MRLIDFDNYNKLLNYWGQVNHTVANQFLQIFSEELWISLKDCCKVTNQKKT
jgi:hypothetical protein